ncbi:HlyD family efflux transporter periplasmic adaptor subunit [Rudanella lutea]|uniref:HlyD family efflux transporter periplasmic adaptor subunit n=1 Tax=Rudanella lutea TaxID=451374 RepID=UPI000365A38A|nr:HlyD family efflux transporter periplasmic adaptor subunit [Rudanella lutea]
MATIPNDSSLDMQEIIGHVPPWIVRWGISLLIVLFGVSVGCAHLISFPEILTVRVMITASEQPSYTSWYSAGNLIYRTPVREGQTVQKGDTVLIEEDIETGKVSYTLAPIGGRVLITKGFENNPKKNTVIIHPTISEYKTYVNIPPRGDGQVAVGQRVLVHLDSYPSYKFGALEGVITSISPTILNNHRQATVRLLNGLHTDRNDTIPVQYHLVGNANIYLDDRSLLQRLFQSH